MDDITGFYSAGVRHAWVKDAAGVVHDLDAIITVGADSDVESTEIPGDDAIKATIYSNNKLSLSVEANSLSFDAYGAITGNTVTQTPAVEEPASPQSAEMAGGTDSELNAPFVELGAVSVGKTQDGRDAYMVRTFHRVQCQRPTAEQGNGSETTWSFDATAYPTTTDVEGEALANKRIDTMKVVIGDFVDNGGAY
jgi:hypothetical protein